MEDIASTLDSTFFGRRDYILGTLDASPDYKRVSWIKRDPTKSEKSSVLLYLKEVDHAVREGELSEALDLDRFKLGVILDDFRRDGYVSMIRPLLVLPKNISKAEKIGIAMSESARGNYYEITEKGKKENI